MHGQQIIKLIYLVLCGCAIWYVTQREERRLRVFEIKLRTRKFVQNRETVKGEWRKCIMKGLVICIRCRILMCWVMESRSVRWAGRTVRNEVEDNV